MIVFVFVLLVYDHAGAQQKRIVMHGQSPIPGYIPDTSWIGIVAGPNFNYLDYYDKTTTISGRNTSFHAGILYEKKISKYFTLQPGLFLSIRGGKIDEVDSSVDAKLVNLELPVNFIYRYKRFIVGGGPNFCYGINGKLKSRNSERNAYDANESFERTLKRFEIGGSFVLGYQFKKGIIITGNFYPGFTNLYKGDGSAPTNVKARTRTIGVSVGYMFGILE